jgi:hypothetical protein
MVSECADTVCLRGSQPGTAVDDIGTKGEGNGSNCGAELSSRFTENSGVSDEDCEGAAVCARDRALATGLKIVFPFSDAHKISERSF